ncbi:MAG TPA: B12-binding domain-containing protein [Acidimicrobiales bacterium]|nr:B12-binding domain-containing protein [Acidimicrobiales bacterium]
MASPPRLSLAEAASALGVHYQTAYRWVRAGVLPAVKVTGAYEVEAAAVDRLRRARAAPVPPPLRRRVRSWAPLVERVLAGLADGDEQRVRELLDDLVASGVSLLEVCDRVLAPALAEIGGRWSTGELSVAGEHRASAICERAIGRWTTPPPGRPRGVAVVCSPPAEGHHLPGHMATAVLRSLRWRVHHLGVGVPLPDIRRLADAEDADLVVLSVVWPPAVEEAHEAAERLGPARRVLVGGPARPLAELVAAVSPDPATEPGGWPAPAGREAARGG